MYFDSISCCLVGCVAWACRQKKRLRMDAAIDKLYRKAKPKARALLRCYRFFGMFDMLCLYKAHVRSQIEWCYSAIYHAAPSLLARLDSVQVSFLSHLGLCDKMAFLTFNVAPLQIRSMHAWCPMEDCARPHPQALLRHVSHVRFPDDALRD